MRRLGVLGICILLVVLSGCGRKTPPVPPQAVIAQAITDLRSQVDDQGVTLTWSYPRLSVNGARIDNIRTFVIYKARIPAADFCAGCPVVYHYSYEISARGHEPGSEITYRDNELEPGYHYVYMVRSSSGWRILSADSNLVDFRSQSSLLAPRDVQIDIGDSSLTLSWAPVRQRSDGSAVAEELQYQVYRSLDNKKYLPLGLPVAGLSYIDPAVVNGRTYFYRVRAVASDNGLKTLGAASTTAIGIPIDMTPPLPPTELAFVARPQGVQLHWQASPSEDVDGYYVYRQAADGRWEHIATTGSGAITYADLSELPPGLYNYRVTAYDRGIRRNESEPSQTVTYTRP